MRTLVLGGSVFVGKHTVEALLAGGHDVAVLNRGRTPTELPDDVERLVADRTDIDQMRGALDGRDWDAVFDVSGFVMAAGGSDIEGLLDLARRPRRPLRLRQLDHGLRPVARRDLPVDRGPADQPGRAEQLRRLQGRGRGRDAGPPPGRPGSRRRSSGRRRSTGRTTTSSTWSCRCSCACSATGRSWCPTAGSSSARTATSTTCARRWSSMVGNPAAVGEVFNITGESVTVNRYIDVLADVVGEEPDVVYLPDAMLGDLPGPVFGHLFGVRHHAMASIEKAQQRLGFTLPLRPALGPRATPTSGSGARGTPTSTGRWSTRCGRRRGTSTPRPPSPGRCAVREPSDARDVAGGGGHGARRAAALARRRLGAGDRRAAGRDGAVRRHPAGRPDAGPGGRAGRGARPAGRQPGRRAALAGADGARRRPSSPPSAPCSPTPSTRDDAAGDEVRAELRPVVSRHLDEDLAVTGMLMPYFRGQLPDA